MLEMTRNILVIISIILVSIYMIQYVRSHTDYRKGLIHKAGNLLLYGYLKACITVGYGQEYLRLKMESIFESYKPADGRLKEVYRKEQRVCKMRQQMRAAQRGYYKPADNKMKVLKII